MLMIRWWMKQNKPAISVIGHRLDERRGLISRTDRRWNGRQETCLGSRPAVDWSDTTQDRIPHRWYGHDARVGVTPVHRRGTWRSGFGRHIMRRWNVEIQRRLHHLEHSEDSADFPLAVSCWRWPWSRRRSVAVSISYYVNGTYKVLLIND